MTADAATGAPTPGDAVDWREHARQLALAVGFHRTHMHKRSNRPCTTCRFSQFVLDRYMADVEREHRAIAARPGAVDGEAGSE